MFPVKYIEDNLIKNTHEEWWAYYRLEPYNYSFTSEEEKGQTFNQLAMLFNQVKTSDIHVLTCSVEERVSRIFEKSKRYIVGGLQKEAELILDETKVIMTRPDYEHPPDMEEPFYTGDMQVDYAFYIGFRLIPSQEDGFKQSLKETGRFWHDAVQNINHNVLGDFTTIAKDELRRYRDIENLTYSRITGNFHVSRLTSDEIAHVIQHLNGADPAPQEEYEYHLPEEDTSDGEGIQVKQYDILKLNNVDITEERKRLRYGVDEEETYCAYLTISEITDELVFPGSEIFYAQPIVLRFPVDTSIRVEVLENQRALKKVRNQKAKLRDMEGHAYQTGNIVDGAVDIAVEDVETLETTVKMNHESMYMVSYIIRVPAPTKEELASRVNAVVDFYSGYSINVICPSGDMLNFHEECIPGARRTNQVVHYFRNNFLAALGVGAGTIMGHKSGIPIGHTVYSENLFCLRPWFGAQGGSGTVTNSLSCAFLGAMGGGKSMNSNFMILMSVLFGARAVIIDPKAERGHWKEAFPKLAHEINIARLTKEPKNKGILDPYLMFDAVEDCEEIAIEVLTFLLGISIQDTEEYPALQRALQRVSIRPVRGLAMVVDELRAENTPVSNKLAAHLQSFANVGLAALLFSDGQKFNTIDLERRLNIIQVDDLMLPDKEKKREEYSSKEILSVAVMMVVSTFNLKFIRTYPTDFKIVNIDEAWSILNVAQGAELTNKLNREGRAMNAGIYYCVQNASDVSDGKIRNSFGMVFVHRITDTQEIKSALDLLGVNPEDENNIEAVRSLRNGECIMRDLYGRVNLVKFDLVVPQIFHAFDTRPKSKNEQGG